MKTVIHITRGIIRDTTIRRWGMFVIVLTAVIMVFLGSTFLEEPLESRPVAFLLYWLACGWLTLLAVLMAAYDMLVVRASGKVARAMLKRRILDEAEKAENEGDQHGR